MFVKANSIRKATKVINAAKGAETIKLVQRLDSSHAEILSLIGFDDYLQDGLQLVPAQIGKYTSFNADGKEVVRKDLPLQPEPVSFHTSWKDGHGNEHSGTCTRMVDKYPRDYIDAPMEKLTLVESGDSFYVTTREIGLASIKQEDLVHLSNVMLEIFGQFQVVDAKKNDYTTLTIKEIGWDILPKGAYPWSKLKPLIGEVIEKKAKSTQQPVVEDRMKTITNFNPDFVAVGRAGFSGYFVYGFENKGIYILESIYLDNATYVFGDDWEKLSKLTKNEIINGAEEHERIIHDKRWGQYIRQILG
ncbi:hypothetical protein [Vibrio japonicus]|uniref:Uncharacterized protein n=1 Tax=Vibrio japonicus TaxID=1824638 RepID=A0ABY5LM01_9VIBR|nr:hypothetical protein [Vibrio japonicus]UUM31792.1 hypothetical protein NP165_06580 [Vibrio japonicus]